MSYAPPTSSQSFDRPRSPRRSRSRSPRRSSRSPPRYRDSSRERRYDQSTHPPSGSFRRSPSPRDRYHRYSGYDDRDRGYDRGYRRRSPPRRREVVRGSEADRRFTTCLYVGNLPYSYRESDVAGIFDRYGRLRSVNIPVDKYTGKNKGFAFVTFEDRREAEDAKDRLENFPVEGRRLRLDWDVGAERKDEIKGIRREPPPSDDRYDRGPDRAPERPPERGPPGPDRPVYDYPSSGGGGGYGGPSAPTGPPRDISPGRTRYNDYGSGRPPSPGLRR